MARRLILALGVTGFFLTASSVSAQVVDDLTRRNALVHYRLGEELMRAEMFDKAVKEFLTAIGLDPLLTLAHYELGQAYMALKRYREAIRAYIGCREAFQRIAGLIASDQVTLDRRREEEIRELQDSIGRFRSGQLKTARSVEGIIARLESRIADLERTRQRGTTSDYETPAEVSMALGSAYFRSGSLVDAEREYVAAIAANSRFGEAHNNLAVVYLLTGRRKDAEAEVKAAEKAGFRVNPQLKDDLKKAAREH
jgi:Flp pilus assembly protein TadD